MASALAQSGLGNTKVTIANPDTGQTSPPQTSNAILQKADVGPDEQQQQQVVRKQEIVLA